MKRCKNYLSNERTRKMCRKKEKPKEMDTSNLPNKEFKEMVIKVLTKLESDIEKLRENFNKEVERIIKNQPGLKNTVTEMKNTLEGIS